ncbi:MAG TPA: alkaline phosphatase family protein [Actinomycetota bacterium]|nr:alkaline phosphatase family protein [Actinomycetota bacterium]
MRSARSGPRKSSAPALSFKRRRRRSRGLPIILLVILTAAGGSYLLLKPSGDETSAKEKLVRACDVDVDILERMWNGYVPNRSGDVLAVEHAPNQYSTRHSSPYPYHQDVPLLLYGPGFIRSGRSVERPVTVADLAPTYAKLLGFDEFPDRDGRVLQEALLPERKRNGVPKLILTLVWDGGGDNVLEQWPDDWPELAALTPEGTHYTEATVGSTPSITPSVHATIGTGAFPSTHGITDTRMRVKNKMKDPWEQSSPKRLRAQTLGDLWDAANGNAPLVGMMARDAWHLGMVGYGAYLLEGDHDIAVLDELGGIEFRTNEDYYSLPEYLLGLEGLEEAVAEVDQRDGESDGEWLGNAILPYDAQVRFTPAWSIYQTEKLIELLETEGFGADDVADLFYVNYKPVDLAGHFWNMVEPEVQENLRETDAQLPVLVEALDRIVGEDEYVLALTADHGMTPYAHVSGGWDIETRDMSEDIEKQFDKVTPEVPLILSNRGYQIMLDRDEMRKNDVTAAEVAAFVRDYRIEDNVTDTNKVLPRFEDHTKDRLFLTALTPEALEEALACARGSTDE